MSNFRVISGAAMSGFQIDFPNGYQVSAMNGKGNYASGRKVVSETLGEVESGSVEIIIFSTVRGTAEPFAKFGLDMPNASADGITMGWSQPEDFAKVIAAVAAYKA